MSESTPSRSMPAALMLIAVFLIAICGLLYELIAGALASYLLGDSVTQFSIVIGLFLSAMGLGSWASRFVISGLVETFVAVEIAIGVVGGFSALLGFSSFAWADGQVWPLLACVVLIGAMVGIEIPLVIRLLEKIKSLRVTVSSVMAVDYVGALAASLLFPFLLLPAFGLVRAAFVTGLVNLVVAWLLLRRLAPLIARRAKRTLYAALVIAFAALGAGAIWSGPFTSMLEDRVYQDDIIYAETTAHQRIVVTRWRGDVRLYLNGHLQFSSIDEYRYHETLAHPAILAASEPRRVLILGGGDGLLARQVLKHPGVEKVTLVDLDPAVTELFRDNEMFAALSGHALSDSRVEIVNSDAFVFLRDVERRFDVILADLPDPSTPAIAKLYSRAFYGLAARRLAPGGIFATQATSPFRSREAFWCIANTMAAVTFPGAESESRALVVHPMHVQVPTFGTWGFILAAARPIDIAAVAAKLEAIDTRYLSAEFLPSLFEFPKDMGPLETPTNDLDDPRLADFYRRGYHRYLD